MDVFLPEVHPLPSGDWTGHVLPETTWSDSGHRPLPSLLLHHHGSLGCPLHCGENTPVSSGFKLLVVSQLTLEQKTIQGLTQPIVCKTSLNFFSYMHSILNSLLFLSVLAASE